MSLDHYKKRIQSQVDQYKDCPNIHALPDIFHYWSNKYLRPRLNQIIGADSVVEFYVNGIISARVDEDPLKVISLGSGDGTLEISIAKALVEKKIKFTIDCLELSPVLAARARLSIKESGLDKSMQVLERDLNFWDPAPKSVDAILANHSLHHMVELELIFDRSVKSMKKTARFITNDVIGRNGHMRWDEAKEWIDKLWPIVPDKVKYNRQLKRFEKEFVNWDCSLEGFEGIRAQDILPLLIDRFEFDYFLAYGGLIDIFIDRSFGHNFDAKSSEDLSLIDFITFLNDRLIDLGCLKPTMMFSVMRIKDSTNGKEPMKWNHWTPHFSTRKTSLR